MRSVVKMSNLLQGGHLGRFAEGCQVEMRPFGLPDLPGDNINPFPLEGRQSESMQKIMDFRKTSFHHENYRFHVARTLKEVCRVEIRPFGLPNMPGDDISVFLLKGHHSEKYAKNHGFLENWF